jgi:uncharacterized sulfatase
LSDAFVSNCHSFSLSHCKCIYILNHIQKWHLNGEERPGWGDESNHHDFGFNHKKYLFNQGHWKFLEEDIINGKMQAYTYEEGEDKFSGREEEHFTTDFLFDRGIEFMEENRQNDDPFLAFLSIPDPHAPKDVRPPYDTMFKDMHFQLPYTARAVANKSPASPLWNSHNHMDVPLDDVDAYLDEYENWTFFQESFQKYFGMVKCIDDNVGKLLMYLKSAGIDNNTIIVFTSDHGDVSAFIQICILLRVFQCTCTCTSHPNS